PARRQPRQQHPRRGRQRFRRAAATSAGIARGGLQRPYRGALRALVREARPAHPGAAVDQPGVRGNERRRQVRPLGRGDRGVAMSGGSDRRPAHRGNARQRDDTGITLSEEGGVRYLHFGSPWVQGAMRIARPWALEIDYVRDMMAWLLFLAPPERILHLGLGAAALTKYCWRRFPDSRVTAVERSAAVIASARRDFALPPDDARLRVVCADAGEFVARPAERGRYGAIQVDLYDRQARGPVLDSVAFYRHCRRALASPGVLAV